MMNDKLSFEGFYIFIIMNIIESRMLLGDRTTGDKWLWTCFLTVSECFLAESDAAIIYLSIFYQISAVYHKNNGQSFENESQRVEKQFPLSAFLESNF